MLRDILAHINNTYGELIRGGIALLTFVAAVYYARFQRKVFVRFVKNDTIKTYREHYLKLSITIKEFMVSDYSLIINNETIDTDKNYSKLNNDFLNLYFESHLFDSNKIKILIENVRNTIVDINNLLEHFMTTKTDDDIIVIEQDNILYQKISALHKLHQEALKVYITEIKRLRSGID